MLIEVYTIDAFSKNDESVTGNPAGVVLVEDALTENQMLNIAEAVGFSETAFVKTLDETTFEVRFFTPNSEVDLCGHATIGAFSALLQLKRIAPGYYTQKTLAGTLALKILPEGKVFMEQARPVFGDVLSPEMILKVVNSLGIDLSDLHDELECRLLSTGLWDLFIPVTSVEVLSKLKPQYEVISALSDALDITGYHVYALTPESEQEVQCRNFAPLYAIPEEAATGTSNGALGAYLNEKDYCGNALIVLQGVEMGRPSIIEVSIETEEDGATQVWVGGYGTHLGKRSVTL